MILPVRRVEVMRAGRRIQHAGFVQIRRVAVHRNAIDSYIEHDNRDRPHRGVENELLTPYSSPANTDGKIVCDEQLGGLIRSYRREA